MSELFQEIFSSEKHRVGGGRSQLCHLHVRKSNMAKSHPVSVTNEPWVRSEREFQQKTKPKTSMWDLSQIPCSLGTLVVCDHLFTAQTDTREAISALLWHDSSICFVFTSCVRYMYTFTVFTVSEIRVSFSDSDIMWFYSYHRGEVLAMNPRISL